MNGARGGTLGEGSAARHDRHEQTRREQTREALLASAHRLWAERGIHGASLDDVAAAAGLTKGAVYSNFTGKTDLLLALLDRYTRVRPGGELCDELRDRGRPAAERAERAGMKHARVLGSEEGALPAMLLVEFWLYGMRDYAAGWRVADWYAARRDVLARDLADRGGVPPPDRATLTMAMDIGLTFQHLLDPERVPAELFGTGLKLVLGEALPG